MLIGVSVSHRTADFELLDRLSAATADRGSDSFLGPDVQGAVLLSTCNRIEAYLDVTAGTDERAVATAIGRLAATVDLPREELRARSVVVAGPDALRHLFSVTAGLESVAVGEDEIAGQVRRAYDAARAAGATTPELDRAFQRAAKVSREIRAATELGAKGRSLVQFALQLASARITDWREARVLVVGTGNYAATTIQSLRALGVTDLTVFSATGRARAFAAKYSIAAAHDLPAALARAEVVITCTRAYTLTPEHFIAAHGDAASEARTGEPAGSTGPSRRLVIDLGLPRNVAVDVARVPGIELMDLEIIAAHTGMPELRHEQDARELVQDAAGRYTAEQLAAPAVVALRRHVFDALDAEVGRAEARAGSPAAAADTVEALRHLAGVLLHTPSERARQLAAEGRIDEFGSALATVFGIDAAASGKRPVAQIRSEWRARADETDGESAAPGA